MNKTKSTILHPPYLDKLSSPHFTTYEGHSSITNTECIPDLSHTGIISAVGDEILSFPSDRIVSDEEKLMAFDSNSKIERELQYIDKRQQSFINVDHKRNQKILNLIEQKSTEAEIQREQRFNEFKLMIKMTTQPMSTTSLDNKLHKWNDDASQSLVDCDGQDMNHKIKSTSRKTIKVNIGNHKKEPAKAYNRLTLFKQLMDGDGNKGDLS